MDHATLREVVKALPMYTEIRFAANGSPMVRGMVRGPAGALPRRITNLDHGTEFFVEDDTELDAVAIGQVQSK